MKSLKEALVLDGKSDKITGEGCYFHFLTHVSVKVASGFGESGQKDCQSRRGCNGLLDPYNGLLAVGSDLVGGTSSTPQWIKASLESTLLRVNSLYRDRI